MTLLGTPDNKFKDIIAYIQLFHKLTEQKIPIFFYHDTNG